jgi:hypothetical protein
MAFPTVNHDWRSFAEEDEEAVSREPMEVGPPRQVVVKSLIMRTVRMKLVFFSKAEYDSFYTWATTGEGKRGGAWFDWTHPRNAVVYQARLKGGQAFLPIEYKRATLDLIDLPIVLEYWTS